MRPRYRMPFGAELTDKGCKFQLWAPMARSVELCIDDRRPLKLPRDEAGWYRMTVNGVRAGARYRYKIDGELMVPDPASRFQPDGVHGASEVIAPVEWDDTWEGRPWHEAVIYELHIGTFTAEGTYRAAIDRLDHVRDLGATAIEIMPLAASPGRWGWGYDGVAWFAPQPQYGRPEDLRALIDAAHARGLMVLLDVVYNHFGPEGNYMHAYAKLAFVDDRETPWGEGLAWRQPAVRDFVIHNALYWIEEYGFDGLRFDAVDQIHDPTVLVELGQALRGTGRHIYLVLEDHDRRRELLELYDGHWIDDLHHVALALGAGAARGRYKPYSLAPLDMLATGLGSVTYLQNHDRVGHRPRGERFHMEVPPDAWRAFTSILLLSPAVPLLFMGEEWAASTPFPFFCDLEEDLHDSVRQGRKSELVHLGEIDAATRIPDPFATQTFLSAKLRWSEVEAHRAAFDHYRKLLAIRAREIAPRLPAVDMTYRKDGRLLDIQWLLADGARLRLLADFSSDAHPVDASALYANRVPGWWIEWSITV